MRVLLDGSVLEAAYFARHAGHERSREWVEALLDPATPHVLLLGAQTLGRLYSRWTDLPLKERVPPAHVFAFLEAVARRATLLPVPAEAVIPLLGNLAASGWGGGVVEPAFAALLAARHRADVLLTLDVERTARAWPAGGERIRSPLDWAPSAV
jgi:predicted nucleic acid-binding protein